MALNSHDIGYAGTGPTLAAPTTTETIANVNAHTYLWVAVAGTATTITVVRPGVDAVGVAVTDQVIGPLSNTSRIIRIDRHYIDPDTALATVQFSQVTGVTASILRG